MTTLSVCLGWLKVAICRKGKGEMSTDIPKRPQCKESASWIKSEDFSSGGETGHEVAVETCLFPNLPLTYIWPDSHTKAGILFVLQLSRELHVDLQLVAQWARSYKSITHWGMTLAQRCDRHWDSSDGVHHLFSRYSCSRASKFIPHTDPFKRKSFRMIKCWVFCMYVLQFEHTVLLPTLPPVHATPIDSRCSPVFGAFFMSSVHI